MRDLHEPPPHDSDSLIVDNRTDFRVVITLTLEDGVRQVAAIGPHAAGIAGTRDRCSSSVLHARLLSLKDEANHTPAAGLPVIDRRPASDGEDCTRTWVVGDE